MKNQILPKNEPQITIFSQILKTRPVQFPSIELAALDRRRDSSKNLNPVTSLA